MNTSVRNNLVLAASTPSGNAVTKAARSIGVCTSMAVMRNNFTSLVKTDSSFLRGGRCIMSGSGGLKERASAGNPSVARLMYRI